MKKTLKMLKKYWMVIWLIVAVLVLSLVVYAEYYAERNRVRRVAANVASEGQLFSSNVLPDLAFSLDSLWKAALRSRLSRQWFLFSK